MLIRWKLPRSLPDRTSTGHGLLWAGAVVAMAGLIGEASRIGWIEDTGGFFGGIVVFYVLYLALSAGMFWSESRALAPATLLICGSLWSLVLRALTRDPGPFTALSLIVVPVASLASIRLTFGDGVEESPAAESPPETVRTLLDRGKGFGAGR